MRRQERRSGADLRRRGPVVRARPLAVALALLASWLAAAALAQSFTNPGFEDGLAGWTTAGSATTIGTTTVATDQSDWTVAPYSGAGSMLRLTPNGAPTRAQAWAELGLPAATQTYLTGIFPNTTDYAYVYRSVDLDAGDTFTLAWNYVATDYDPFNDGSFVLFSNLTNPAALPLIDGEVGDLRLLGVTVTGGNYVTGSYGSTGWQTVSFEARAAGTYRLALVVFNLDDTAYPPYLFVDEASGTTLKDGTPFAPIPPSDDAPPPMVQPDALVDTGAVSAVTAVSATVAGTLTDPGATAVTAHGHVWSTSPNPTVNLATKTDLGAAAGAGSFASDLTGLQAETTYYVRAYATNMNGTAYGDEVSFTTAAPPSSPSVTTSAGSSTFSPALGPVVVDPGLTVSDDDVHGATVSIESGFTPGDTLAFTPLHGVTGSFNAATGVLTLTGTATAAQYQEVLRSVTFSTASQASDAPRTITFNLAGEALYLAYSGHFYEFVTAPAIAWTDAHARAEAMSSYGSAGYPAGVYGLQGYLVTVTSAEENAFVAAKLQGQGWMGASDDGDDKVWRWVAGPEAGTVFFHQNGYNATGPNSCGSGGTAVGGAYVNWDAGEPNDFSGGCANGENFAHFLESGKWNDYPNSNSNIAGYVVEYGSPAEADAIDQLTASKTVELLFGPELTSFSPTSAGQGETVTITGSNLTGTTEVSFGGVPAFDFTVVNDTTVEATVAYGSSGPVEVTTSYGEAELAGFAFEQPEAYTFDYLPIGRLDGVDGWTTAPIGGSSYGMQVLVPGVTAPLDGGSQNTAVPGHDGSRAARFPFGGLGVGGRAYRVDNANWSLPDVPAGQVTVVELEMLVPTGGGGFALGRDADGDGTLQQDEQGLALTFVQDEVWLSRPGKLVSADRPELADRLARFQVVIDRGLPGGVAHVSYRDIGTPGNEWLQLEAELDLGLGQAGVDDPNDWNAFAISADSWDPTFLFDDLGSRAVATSTRALDLGDVNVGSASTAQTVSVSGQRLTGDLTATVTGDFLVNGGTTVAGVGDGTVLSVTFHPTAGGTRTGELVLQGGDMAAPLVIALTGQGVPPTITSFDPATAATGTPVVISGVNLSGATAVRFGGVDAYSFEVVSDTEVHAVLGSGASGAVEVVTPNGTASLAGFTALPAGSVYLETDPGPGRYTMPADHPALADGALEPDEYAGDVSLDVRAGGSLALLPAGAALVVDSAADLVVAASLDAGARDATLLAVDGEVRVLAGGAVTAYGDVTLAAGSWTNQAGPAALDSNGGRVRVYTESPLNDQNGGVTYRERFGVAYPEDPLVSGDVLYYQANLVEGHVFVDADLSGVMGAGEAGLAGVAVTLEGAGTSVVTDGTGRYRFIGAPAGDYEVVADDPSGYVAVGSNRLPVTLAPSGVVEGLDVGYHAGARIAGVLFRDDGLGGGAANDGVQDGGEVGVAGVRVSAAHPGGLAITTTGPDGSYELFVAAGPVTLTHEGTTATGRFDGTAAVLADSGPANLVVFTAAGGADYRHDFGVVPASALTPALSQGQVSAPGVRSYLLGYRPGTEGQVTFDVPPGRLAYRLFLDATCVGLTGEVAVGEGAAVSVGPSWPRDDGRLADCALRLEVHADAGTGEGTSDVATVTAALQWANQVAFDMSAASVETDVVGPGRLAIAKEGRNVAEGGAFSTRFEGAPGDVLEYRVSYANIGTADVFDVVLRAVVHGPTEVIEDAGAAVLVCPDGSSVDLTLTGPAIAVDLAAACSLELRPAPDGSGAPRPALRPGEGGTLVYRVRIL